MNEQEQRQEIALDAVADLIHRIDPGSMVTRFVLVAEVVDRENERGCWMLTPPDSTAWDSLGLCHYAIAFEHADINRHQEDQ